MHNWGVSRYYFLQLIVDEQMSLQVTCFVLHHLKAFRCQSGPARTSPSRTSSQTSYTNNYPHPRYQFLSTYQGLWEALQLWLPPQYHMRTLNDNRTWLGAYQNSSCNCTSSKHVIRIIITKTRTQVKLFYTN